jgi:hypothetical protein
MRTDQTMTMQSPSISGKPPAAGATEYSQKTLQSIKNALQEAANRHGLKIKKHDQAAKDIHEQLSLVLKKILTKIKDYFE